ncbi:uncharacterized protein LOC132721244 [Ruditapes philippinarum]|uniref:uncharacterized protein LOC132721244 n=1 Tax=Ruditapes philippinarum TaxID=129788 RepID=UPI00295B4F0F|nr:uncharacterized protein LOC132721244 [Ruditapes philippinarum]
MNQNVYWLLIFANLLSFSFHILAQEVPDYMQIDRRRDVNDINIIRYLEKPQVNKRNERRKYRLKCGQKAKEVLKNCLYQTPLGGHCDRFKKFFRNCIEATNKKTCLIEQGLCKRFIPR